MNLFIHSVLYAFYLLLFLWLIFKWKFFETENISRKHFAFFFLIKVTAGICLTLIYTYYYTDPSKADIYRYFNDSKIISQVLFQNFHCWLKIMSGYGAYDADAFSYLVHTQYFSHTSADAATDNTFIIRLNVLLNYLSYSNIFINTLFFNFFCFIGLTGLFKSLLKYFITTPLLLCIPIYLLPSVVFWSSGLLKESLLFTCLGLGIYLLTCFDKVLLRIVSLIFFSLLLFIKPAVFLCLIAATGIYLTLQLFLIKETPFSKRRTGAIVICFWLIAICILASKSSSLCEKIIDKRNEFVFLALQENAGSLIDQRIFSANCTQLFSITPAAVVNSILRPFIWEKNNAFQFLFAFENFAFILLLLYLLIRYFKLPKKEKSLPAVFFFTFAFLIYIAIGLTVPVAGAIVHYRVIASPFLFLGLLFFVSLEKKISNK
ncbi:MAG: hypothetical protein NTY88_11950 [Bacteroidetes bacterium]|nr:hypothetical protein [Bacteroidota bacterium]